MTRSFAFVLLLVVCLVIVGPLAAQDAPTPEPVGLRPDAPQYALHGPYWVGTTQMESVTEFHPTTIQIWYPALNPDTKSETITYTAGPLTFEGHAILDAEPNSEGGPYPLVLFAHGLGASNLASIYLAEHLASEGFVVAAINYADSGNLGPALDPAFSLYTRPRDVSWQIDYLDQLNADESGMFQDLIDMEQIAVVGVSYGGYTALMAGGALLDLTSPTSWCAEYPLKPLPIEIGGGTLQERFCNNADQVAELAGLQSVPNGPWPSWADSRIDAIVPLAPWMPFMSDGEHRSITIPTMLMYGSPDHIVDTGDPLYQLYAYDNLGSTSRIAGSF